VNPLLSTCPVPHRAGERELIQLAHGEGARLTRRLIYEVLLQAFDNEYLRPLADGAVLPPIDGKVVMTTDNYVVSPLFFPGGDIGKLAVHGAINDLAVCGAVPLYLSLGLIAEEGLPMDVFQRVAASIGEAARACRVLVVTGDTKVVPRGAADGLFVNTTGIGRLRTEVNLGVHRVGPGDRVLVSGTLGDHGIAILAAREGFELESPLASDTAALFDLVQSLFESGIDVHFLRDPTRGGVSAVLHELCAQSGVSVLLEENSLPMSPGVRGACELLGLDPLYVANEGKLLMIVAPADTERALACLRQHPLGKGAAVIGNVMAQSPPQVLIRGVLRTVRILDEPSGAPLPRIC
jgi:hydrogenase expression/formation protein HypE